MSTMGEVEKFYVDGHRGESDKELAAKLGVTAKAVAAYRKTLPPPDEIELFAVKEGSVSMTAEQATKSDPFLPDGTPNPDRPKTDGQRFLKERSSCIFNPRAKP